MELHYNKNNNTALFLDFENSNLVNVRCPQSYIPIYNNFFSLNNTNYNHINLNQKYSLFRITEKKSENKYVSQVKQSGSDDKTINKEVFFKFSPLFDPIKFMIGKYDGESDFLNLPEIDKKHKHDKLDDPNNAAYVDSFFTYLTSQLLNCYDFIHGVDFYGSFLGIKRDYLINVADDIDYLLESSYFNNNNNVCKHDITFTLDNDYLLHDSNNNSRSNKGKLQLTDTLPDETVLNLSDISDIKEFDTIFTKTEDVKPSNEKLDLMFECKNITTTKTTASSSSCSSRTSNTNTEDSNSESGSECSNSEGSSCKSYSGSSCSSGASGSSYSSMSSMESDEEIFIHMSEFPVQMIALENCDETLDNLLTKKHFEDGEWDSMVIQVIMMLIAYQNVFDLTHNDLHTNNIMYVTTDKQFLNYRLDGKYYKVPTYGRIYKIIDFGRAIYRFRGKLLCSDSFHPKGDAATQYNFEPYMNPKKPLLEPNKSFDLCRLGCSLFDFIVQELEDDDVIQDIMDIKKIPFSIKKIILEWCDDDKGRNIIYKNNGEERYPEFKLYKMIARTVNKHTPHNVIKYPYFEKYIVSKKKINGKKFMDLDKLPSLK